MGDIREEVEMFYMRDYVEERTEDMMVEVSLYSCLLLQGDIMGDIREEVEMFYMRDYVEERTEDRMVEHLSLSDLIFSRNKRVKVTQLLNLIYKNLCPIEFIKILYLN